MPARSPAGARAGRLLRMTRARDQGSWQPGNVISPTWTTGFTVDPRRVPAGTSARRSTRSAVAAALTQPQAYRLRRSAYSPRDIAWQSNPTVGAHCVMCLFPTTDDAGLVSEEAGPAVAPSAVGPSTPHNVSSCPSRTGAGPPGGQSTLTAAGCLSGQGLCQFTETCRVWLESSYPQDAKKIEERLVRGDWRVQQHGEGTGLVVRHLPGLPIGVCSGLGLLRGGLLCTRLGNVRRPGVTSLRGAGAGRNRD